MQSAVHIPFSFPLLLHTLALRCFFLSFLGFVSTGRCLPSLNGLGTSIGVHPHPTLRPAHAWPPLSSVQAHRRPSGWITPSPTPSIGRGLHQSATFVALYLLWHLKVWFPMAKGTIYLFSHSCSPRRSFVTTRIPTSRGVSSVKACIEQGAPPVPIPVLPTWSLLRHPLSHRSRTLLRGHSHVGWRSHKFMVVLLSKYGCSPQCVSFFVSTVAAYPGAEFFFCSFLGLAHQPDVVFPCSTSSPLASVPIPI